MVRWRLLIYFLRQEVQRMRIKFDKQYLKYYTYAVLGVITIILFYKILDNLGFWNSAAHYHGGSAGLLFVPPHAVDWEKSL